MAKAARGEKVTNEATEQSVVADSVHQIPGTVEDGGPVEDCAECDGLGDELKGDLDEHEGMMMDEQNNKARIRPRKRKRYGEICKQLEFYFSDANVSKNRLMQEMVLKNNFVDLKTFLDFNRIKSLTLKLEDLQKSLVSSDKLELSADGNCVRRKVPYDPKKLKPDSEIEECTIYVENVPKHADHAFLETIFQSFGPIAYVSMPKFKTSKLPKGFAFIEFDSPETAQRCLEAYKGEGACFPPNMDPASLMSIQTYNDEHEPAEIGTGNINILPWYSIRLIPHSPLALTNFN